MCVDSRGMRLLGIPGAIALGACLGAGLASSPAAQANHYHTACVNHGFVHGSSTTDNAFHSRIEAGCGNPGLKRCRFNYIGGGGLSNYDEVPTGVNLTCNFFSNNQWGELASTAEVLFEGVFSAHGHGAH
jgi:hypothetical protein